MGLFRRLKILFTPLTESQLRDRRRDKLIYIVEHRLKYAGVECEWEDFKESGSGSRTKRVTKVILID